MLERYTLTTVKDIAMDSMDLFLRIYSTVTVGVTNSAFWLHDIGVRGGEGLWATSSSVEQKRCSKTYVIFPVNVLKISDKSA